MSVKIYHKTDLRIVSTVPQGVSPERDFELNVGGNIEDYGFIDVPYAYFELQKVNGEVVAIELQAPDIEPPTQPPSEIELLKTQVEAMSVDLEAFMEFYFSTL
ncbi:hypothetical protein RRV45_15085 [Bacillus sp. DTU_2020_1000418_1_SI_GHA_SEK_038]|uniref:hypothetical protein n=1 Tax=Bacillus sp. DTU_2020_1000418_1_SI_GHA_SEK_038 TaxID=3077585 RepID=UPI0028E25C83|nr:hypothetical protein [Bacillus sp. DTU_2020_1000418_1_SI_GHA_SEK_038]WNS74233.1 hypothetical protein RRV45_15085 [Bacillus sp. DTU_2020_1000418_1_SI_GHA_SEK_038]